MEERKLAEKLKKRSRTALEQTVALFTPYVSTVAWRTLGEQAGREDLEEIVSDVFLALWENAPNLNPAQGLRPWLGTVARHKALDRLRRPVAVPLEEDTPSPAHGPEDVAEGAKAELNSDDFINMDTFYSRSYDAAGERIYGPGGGGAGEIKERRTEDSRTYHLSTDLLQGNVRFCHTFGFLPKGMELEVPMDHPAQALRMEADFQSVTEDGKPYTFTGVTVTPLSFKLRYHNLEAGVLDIPYFFRMTDGSILTMNQLLNPSSDSGGQDYSGGDGDMENRRFFRSPLDLSTLDAIIVDGRAFPLGGGKPEDVTVDPKFYPTALPLMGEMEGDGPYGISVRALCDALGATCVWDNTAQSATLTYRGVTVVLTLGSKEALINGESVALRIAPEAEDGKLKIAMSDTLCDAWGIDAGINYDFATGIAVNWNICP